MSYFILIHSAVLNHTEHRDAYKNIIQGDSGGKINNSGRDTCHCETVSINEQVSYFIQIHSAVLNHTEHRDPYKNIIQGDSG